MKTFIITALFVVLSSVTFSQESEHLTFKGVPIDGSLSTFVSKMKSAGFSYLGEMDGFAIMYGDFAGYHGCAIGVNTLKSLNVSFINVIFPVCNDWATLEDCYDTLKEMLTQKYGNPVVVEQFQGRIQPETNNEKLHELYMNRCTWSSLYITPKGNIELSLQKSEYGSSFVLLEYYDKINTDSVRSMAIDDL